MAVEPNQPQVEHPYVTRNAEVCGGKPVIGGTRIKVAQIALEYDHLAWAPDEILQAHPHLTLAQIHDALSYYYENADEIRSDLRADEDIVTAIQRQHQGSSIEHLGGDA